MRELGMEVPVLLNWSTLTLTMERLLGLTGSKISTFSVTGTYLCDT